MAASSATTVRSCRVVLSPPRTASEDGRQQTRLDGKEHRSESVLLAGPAAILDDRGRRRTVMDDGLVPVGGGTETTTETRNDETRPLIDQGNGYRRRSARWRWDLNPRESYPSTRFRDLHHDIQDRPHPSPPACFARCHTVLDGADDHE